MSKLSAPEKEVTTYPEKSPFLIRQSQLAKTLDDQEANVLALNPGSSLAYLTGLHFHLMERPVVAFFVPGQPITLVIPELEIRKTEGLSFPVKVYTYGEDPASWPVAFSAAAEATGVNGKVVGVEALRLRVLELRLLEEAAPQASFVPAEEILAQLRMRKDQSEIAAMRKAVEIAQEALLATLPSIKAGITEREIAAELTLQLLRHGSDPELPFAPIVSSGPNSANPHAVPTDRPLQPGDLLVIDWGAVYQGYISDLTRTFAIQKVEPELAHIAEIVKAANSVGRETAAPEMTASEVDQVTRAVITRAGYGQFFTHRTGHGIGMEGHEGPYIRDGNALPLLPGMTFTIEPGIYLPGRGGVRIEDNMLITSGGAETLSSLPRELQIIG